MRYALCWLLACMALVAGYGSYRWLTSPEKKYPAMRLALDPVTKPELVGADMVDLPDDAIVIGIVVNGEPRAYLREAFELDPGRHVVHDVIQSRRIAITHCDRKVCSRVLTGTDPGEPLDVAVGGWRHDQTMELIVNRERYSHQSSAIPLVDWPYVEVPWSKWRREHPDTLVYVGNLASDAIVPR